MLEPKKPRVAAAKTTAAKASSTESKPAPQAAQAKAPAPAPSPPPAKAPAPIAVKATPAPKAPAPAPVAAKPAPAAKAPAKPKPKPAAPVAKEAAPIIKAQEAPAPVAREIPVAEPVVKQPVVNPVAAEGSMKMATTTTAAVENTTEKFQSAFNDVQGRTKAALEKSAKFYEELGEFTKGNIEAVIASSKVAASAAEAIGQDAAAFGKKNLEQATATFKSLAAAKSPTELLQLQSDYARSAFDSLVAESSRVSEKLVKLASDIAQPISSRFAVAAEKVKTTAL